jgi:hypothetical protein
VLLEVLRDAALDVREALPDQGRLDRLRLQRREAELLELVRVRAGARPDLYDGPREIDRRDREDALARLDECVVGVILPLNHGLWPCDPKSFGAIRRVQRHRR